MAVIDEAEEDVLAHMHLPREHRTRLHSTNPLEPFNPEIKRHTYVVKIAPSEAAIRRVVGRLLAEQHSERTVQRTKYMVLDS